MSISATIAFEWADGHYTFRLPIGQLRELQDKCGAGPRVVFERLRTGTWLVDDIRETIRLGLIGGGQVKPIDARVLVERYVDPRPLSENVMAATSILLAAIVGVPDDQVGKEAAERAETEATGALSSPPSTATAPSSAGHPARSTN